LPVETDLVEVTKAAADARRVPHRLVKILQVKDRRIAVRCNEIQYLSWILSAGFRCVAKIVTSLRFSLVAR
jgi:hypothetical protein